MARVVEQEKDSRQRRRRSAESRSRMSHFGGQFAARSELHRVIGNGHGGIGRNHVNVIGLDGHAVGHFLDAHSCSLGEEFDEHAVMLGIEMLNEDKSHAGIGGEIADEQMAALMSE